MYEKKIIEMPVARTERYKDHAQGGERQNDGLISRTMEPGHVIPLRMRAGSADKVKVKQLITSGSNDHIAVSVVVPTCGRAELLERCLDALNRQSLKNAYEVIVVDDRPNQTTKNIVAKWAERSAGTKCSIIYIPNDGPHGPAVARNRGWRAAHASIIAFTDDDTVPTPEWLRNGLAAFDDTVHAICGRIEMPLPDPPTDYERDARQLETAEFVTANCFCRKEVLDFINGFDEQFRFAWREDSDLHFRLLGLRAKILYVPQAVVVHPVMPAPWGVSILQQKKIVFDALLYKKHPLLYRQKIRATPRWDYYGIVIALLGFVIALAAQSFALSMTCGVVWLLMTAQLLMLRMRGTTKTFSHVMEMAVTSIFIPPHAVFWRIVGALRYRVLFI